MNPIDRLAAEVACNGSTRDIEDHERLHGEALSTTLDALWSAAEEAGQTDLAARLEAAYNHLTGVEKDDE